MSDESRKIVLVASVVAPFDAISLAVRDTFFGLKRNGFSDVVLFCSRCEYDDMNVVVCPNAAVVLKTEQFLDADLILYHFGIYHPLFDALLVGNGKAKQAVFYHNVTPLEFVPEAGRDVIRRSLVQIHNLRHADRLWPVSPFNADCLRDFGFDSERIEVIPLVVDKPEIRSPLAKSDSGNRILFVGRVVESKGLLDALRAFEALYADQPTARFVIASNVSFSDPDYFKTCERFIEEHGLAPAVRIVELPDDYRLCELFADAHVLLLPTRHEGFCVPVIEALRAGAIPVGFDAGNMKNVCEGLGRLVQPGKVGQLFKALEAVVEDLRAAHHDPAAGVLRLDRGVLSLREFEAEARIATQRYSFDAVAPTIVKHVVDLLDFPPGSYDAQKGMRRSATSQPNLAEQRVSSDSGRTF